MGQEQQANLAASLKEINELANEAYAAKLTADKFEAKAKELKGNLSSLMETAGVDKISADACTVSGKIKASASVPKEDGDKLALYKYIASLDNVDPNGNPVVSVAIEELMQTLLKYPTLFGMLSINATAFSSWYNKEMAAQIATGKEDWQLPFISTYEYYSIGMRKKKATV